MQEVYWHIHFSGGHSSSHILHLQVDEFCRDICVAALQWWGQLEKDDNVNQRINNMVKVLIFG